MKKASIKKLSILSLVLIGASAVTAAILPKAEKRSGGTPGVLENSTAGGQVAGVSCVPGEGAQCTYTDGSATTNGGVPPTNGTSTANDGDNSTNVNTTANGAGGLD